LDDFPEIEALKKGSQSAFNSLIATFSQKVYNLSLGILQNEEDAEDVTQEIFTTVFLSINQFKGDSKLSTWIYRISVNKCQEFLRKKTRKKRFGFIIPIDKTESTIQISSNFMHPGLELENQERGAILFAAINALPENQKTAFTLFNLESIPYEEIAQIMNTSLSAVESLIFRARQNLKKSLSDYYEENER
jgi:RNA polymerase sigma-70 factor (ECF subfamily)